MLRNLTWLLMFVVIGLPVILISIANRHKVHLILDPFSLKIPALSVELPFFLYLFAAFFTGFLLGGLVVWLGQGKWRKKVRTRTQEVVKWRDQADQLRRKLQAGASKP